MKIEGNSLNEKQINALLENKRVIGPKKDIIEVVNAIKVYENLKTYNPYSEKSILSAHKELMFGLINNSGNYRNQGIGVVKGKKIEHLAPPHLNVPFLMKELFNYLGDKNELILIKSCVFHYVMEFIHPFSDGNGRMGRLWQNLILIQEYPVFEFISLETVISNTQTQYYKALSDSDRSGNSTKFIEYMLNTIDDALKELLTFNGRTLTQEDRLRYFIELNIKEFARKDYMNIFKNISSATASRDLGIGIKLNLFRKIGDKNLTKYQLIKN